MLQRRADSHFNQIALALILVVAAALRLYGQDWDEGHYLHPDERFIATVSSDRVTLPADEVGDILDPAHSPINPRRDDDNGNSQSFAYGTLPIYVQGAVSWALDLVLDGDYGEYRQLYKVGRTLTALLDVLTVLMVYLLGSRLFGTAAGLLGAALYTLAVLPIQLSHFFAVDPWLTAFVTTALYLSIRYLDQPTTRRAMLLAIPVGCAFATKASVPSLLVPLILVFGYTFWRSTDRWRVAGQATLGGLVAVAVFTMFEPYALVRSEPFIQDIRTQARIVRGTWDVPFTRQFVGLTPGIYELRNLFSYSVGPGLLVAGLAGLGLAIRRVVRARDLALAVPLTWVAAYVPVLMITEARFLRYMMPLIPVMALLSAGLLWRLLAESRLRRLGQTLTVVVLGISAVWAFGFVSIYNSEHPRIAASEWIFENIDPDATLSAESWDDALPLRLDGHTNTYTIQSLDIYGDLPPEEKVNQLYDALVDVDYIVMSSDRLVDSVDNLPWRYAVQNDYYRRLERGQLGFQLVYRVERRPELFGIRFNDSNADESFTVYDHPRVQIFERVENLSRDEFRQRLLWGVSQPWEPQRYPARERLLLDQPVEERSFVSDIGWNRQAVGSAPAAILAWLIGLELFGLAVLPWSALLFRNSRDRGALATRLIGILATSWIVWIGASLKLWPSSAVTVAIVLLVLGIANWTWYRWRAEQELQPVLPTLRVYGAVLALLLAVFVPFLLLRALYPDFWQTFLGGEKPFELAYLRAVAASPEMPPYDPWYSDGAINYYYYGWHLVSTIGRLPGVGITHAFQLAIPTFAALLAMQVWLVGSLLNPVRRRIGGSLQSFLAPGIAVVGVLFVANLDAVRQLAEIRGQASDRFDFWASTRVIDFTINEFPFFTFLWADLHPHLLGMPVVVLVLGILVTSSARSIEDQSSNVARVDTTGALVVASALAIGSVFVINAWDLPLMIAVTVAALVYAGILESVRRAFILFIAAVVVIAAAYAMFLPFHAHFYSVVEGVARTANESQPGEFLTVWGIFFAVIAVLILDSATAGLKVRTWLHEALAVLAPFGTAVAVGGLLNPLIGDRATTRDAIAAFIISGMVIGVAAIATQPLRLHLLPLLPVAVMTVASGFFVTSSPSAAIALSFASAASLLALHAWKSPSQFLPWAFVAVGCLTIASTEFVFIVDDLQGGDWQRMNTVFKFYMQAWLLIAIGCGVLFGRMLQNVRIPINLPGSRSLGLLAGPIDSVPRSDAPSHAVVSSSRTLLAGIGVLALALGLIYPLFGTPVRLRQDMPSSPTSLTLDGYAWMEHGTITNGTGDTISFSGDLEAIRWLQTNAAQTSVLVEAGIGPYRGNGARISSGTGLPAVIGWDRHQYQQRYPEGIAQRMADVRTIYNSTDARQKLELLRRYNVRYVIVGDVERFWNTPDNPEYYTSTDGLATFETMLGSSLRMAFVSGSTRLYEVLDFPVLQPRPGAEHDL